MADILLIEPDALLADSYTKVLEREGHSVRRTKSAQAAITAADQSCPDAVILELQLVGHNGLEFLYEFRSYPDWKQVPVTILSVIPKIAFKDSWALLTNELGVGEYLYKPRTNLQALVRAVKEVTATLRMG